MSVTDIELPEDYRAAMAEDTRPEGDGEFEPFDDGYYLAKIEKVSLSPKAGPSGFKQVIFVWRIQKPGKWAKRTQWDRISLSPKAAFKMRELFDACGYEYDSNPGELIGEVAILELEQVEVQSGPKKGEISNDVVKVYDAEDPEYRALVGK